MNSSGTNPELLVVVEEGSGGFGVVVAEENVSWIILNAMSLRWAAVSLSPNCCSSAFTISAPIRWPARLTARSGCRNPMVSSGSPGPNKQRDG